MPNYEYRCDDCSTSEDHHRDVYDRDKFPTCQYCTRLMRRIIQSTPVKFNGTGFYSTGGQMTEEELQKIRNAVVEACDSVLENYDWDKAFIKYMEAK